MDIDRKVFILDVNDILPNRFQPRIRFNEESINELCDSIREHGVIQPIVVRKMGDKFEIIAGERRFKASLLAGKNTIPAIVTELNDKESAEIALIENVQRKDLTPIEEAISYKKILDMGYLTQDGLANKLGKTQSTVANKLRLLNLTDDVQEALLEGKISERHARSILRLPSPSMQKEMLNKIIIERLTVRKVDEEISKILKGEIEAIDKKINESVVPFVTDEKVNFMTAPNFGEQNEQIGNNETVVEKPISGFMNDLNIDLGYAPSFEEQNKLINNNETISSKPNNEFVKDLNVDLGYTPYYEKEEEEEKTVVPTFNGEKETIIPTFDFNNLEPVNNDEPVVIIEEEENMLDNNQFNNNQNDFNPFDMTTNEMEVPSAPIEESPQLGSTFQSKENEFIKLNQNESVQIVEPKMNTVDVNNYQNPGFMDIDRIKNEAVDIDFTNSNPLDYEPTKNLENNTSNNDEIFNFNQLSQNVSDNSVENFRFNNEEPLLRENVQPKKVELEENIVPGKFFTLPVEEEENKNEEVQINSNPFEININNADDNFKLNMPEQERVKTLDEISHFADMTMPYNNQETNDTFIKPLMEEPVNKGYNPANEFNFNSNNNENIIKPTLTEIPKVETTTNTINMSHQSFMPKEKDINTAMLAIKECESKLRRLGFNVNTEDFDFENMYQIMFRIEK